MNFIVGGYFLVLGTERKEWMNPNLLPSLLWSVSRCICDILPDSWVFSWTTDAVSSPREQYQKLLRLTPENFHRMQLEFDAFLENDKFGFPNVFFDLQLAQRFCSQYLQHLSEVKLLSIALRAEECANFITHYTPPPQVAENGVRRKLRAGQSIEEQAQFRGFEILGHDGASFCSFVCNSLEKDYHEKLGIRFNQHGLIDYYIDAQRAANYAMLDEVGAEPYLWHPWAISEYPLEAIRFG